MSEEVVSTPKTATAPKVSAGDVVKYVPGQVHARQPDKSNDYPWIFGWKTGKRKRSDDGMEMLEEVIELTSSETSLKLKHIRMQPPERAAKESTRLVFLRPNVTWEAAVKAVNLIGPIPLVDIDVKDPTTGSVLHYDGVPFTDKFEPHTCHK